MDMTAVGSGELNQERLNFVLEELKKNHIPNDFVKKEFFARYFPGVPEEEVKQYFVIMNHKHKENIQESQLDWIKFDEYIPEDSFVIYNPNNTGYFGDMKRGKV